MTEKEIEEYLIINWKEGKTRTRKSEPQTSELGTNEVYAELEVAVNIPEVDVAKIAAKVDVPEARVEAANLQALTDEELPDWTDTALEVVNDNWHLLEDVEARNPPEFVDIVTARALTEVATRPDPDKVRDFIRERVEGRL
jgi:hypothetical protein